MPGVALLAGPLARAKRNYEREQWEKEWKQFNPYYLRRNLRRLHKQKIVEVLEENGNEIIRLTQKGRTRYLRFKLEKLSLKGMPWNGKWWLVLYDISHLRRNVQANFRRIIKLMNFLPLQKSVYLTPYPCSEEIEYLREYFHLSEEVLLLEVSGLEHERYYREYFGL